MKIAVVTNNQNTIHAHFGRASYYQIFTIENGEIVDETVVEKAGHHNLVQIQGEHEHGHHHDHDHEHGHGHNHEQGHGFGHGAGRRHAAMFEPILDCDALLAAGMGRGAYVGLQNAGVRPIVTDIYNIREAVQAYIDGTIVDHTEKLH